MWCHLWCINRWLGEAAHPAEGGRSTITLTNTCNQSFFSLSTVLCSQNDGEQPLNTNAYTTPSGKMLGGPSQEIPSKTGQQIIQTLISNSNNCSAKLVKSFTTACFSSKKNSTYHSRKNKLLRIPENPVFSIHMKKSIALGCDRRTKRRWRQDTCLPDGRYWAPIPSTRDRWRLERNLQLATRRLESTLVRLRRSPQDLADYEKEIKQLIDNQFFEVADMEYNNNNNNIYL